MLKDYSQKCLTALLTIVSAVTFINMLIMYWIPINIPLSSFSAVRIVFIAFAEKKYYLIPICIMICMLLFLSAISVHRRRRLLPVLSLLYLSYDFVIVLLLFVEGLSDGYWKTYALPMIVLISLIVLLSTYCWNCLVSRKTSSTEDGSEGQGDGSVVTQ